ncbi:MAG: hypothetical protein H0X36_01015 [Sphingomonadaceae bacterium]|nr:hypothetical protein [Sphingomonadaceae bacterium]
MDGGAGRVKARGANVAAMVKPDEARLAEALRANLKKRKERMHAAVAEGAPVESFGADEEGDSPVPDDGDKPGAWVRMGSKKV